MSPQVEDVEAPQADAEIYVYCLVRSSNPPDLSNVPDGLSETGPVRALAVAQDLWLVVASISDPNFGESAIAAGLQDLDWVSERALAHEAVVEFVFSRLSVVPLKLFTMFRQDERAASEFASREHRLARLFDRLDGRVELGLRVHFDSARARQPAAPPSPAASGRDYLLRKKRQRDRPRRLANEARTATESLFEKLDAEADVVLRKPLPEAPGALLLDAACLVDRERVDVFESLIESESRRLAADAPILVTLSGPFPPYHFVDGILDNAGRAG